MEQWLIEYPFVRLGVFILTFGLLAGWETYYPWRRWMMPRRLRIARHLSLTIISKICVRLIFPFFLFSIAISVQEGKIGLLNQTDWPLWVRIIVGMIAMDFVIYLQHRLLHHYPFLWRIHRLHHIDKQLDVSTGVRFHPLEEIFSMGAKVLGVGFFGVPPLGAFVFEVWLNIASLYTHVNVRLTPKTEKLLRLVIVTPGMHRIHHSDYSLETNSNYGFGLSCWDKLFGSYRLFARTGERKLLIGLEGYREPARQTLVNMLLDPFNLKQLRPRVKKPKKTKFSFHEELPLAKPKA